MKALRRIGFWTLPSGRTVLHLFVIGEMAAEKVKGGIRLTVSVFDMSRMYKSADDITLAVLTLKAYLKGYTEHRKKAKDDRFKMVILKLMEMGFERPRKEE
jgi:hypothetical protein